MLFSHSASSFESEAQNLSNISYPGATSSGVFGFTCKATLASGIDIGQGINIGSGKFSKKNKRRALNTHVLCCK